MDTAEEGVVVIYLKFNETLISTRCAHILGITSSQG